MRFVPVLIAAVVSLAGCQTIPWPDSGPIFKMTNIVGGDGECMALTDLNGKPVLRLGKVFVLDAPDCDKVKGYAGLYRAETITIRADGQREGIAKLSWATIIATRKTPSSWAFALVPKKKKK